MKYAETEQQGPVISTQLPAERRIEARLAYLYGNDRSAQVARRIARLLNTHRQLRRRVVEGPLWSQEDTVLITYGDSVQSTAQPPLPTLHAFLKQHLQDAFSMIHILPFFPWSSDDGFSVTDFRSVKPELGSWHDLRRISEDFDLAIDLVLNHCSRENLWFVDYIFSEQPGCRYFIEVDPATNVSMVTRPRPTPLLSGVRTQTGMRHVWATFSNDQIDFNYANPDVLIEFIDILLYYIRRGARMIRLDAVAYLWKTIGTRCIHLPQTHQVVKLFRDVLELVEPGALIMTETNVPHAENMSYFGAGDEAHVIYQFSLPPLLLHALHAGNAEYLNAWAAGLEAFETPPGCTYLNFTASHDGVGLRPLEGLVPATEVDALLETMRRRGGYISTKSNSDGTESPYELNISYFDAFRDSEGDNRWHVPMFMVSQIVALSFKGIPAVYLHCLTATPNDTLGVERTGMTRSVNRRKWDRAELERLLNDPATETGRVFAQYRRLLALRRRQPAFHPDAAQQLLAIDDSVFCFERIARDDVQRILVVANLSCRTVGLSLARLPADLPQRGDLLEIQTPRIAAGSLTLAPYAVFWFSRRE
jgi:sucrose phosphorylase